LPFFAIGVPNPKASMGVLRVFTHLAGVSIDFDEITERAKTVERGMLNLLEKMNEAAQAKSTQQDESFTLPGFAGEEEEEEESPAEESQESLATRDQQKIRFLFEQAKKDRAKALELKHELDRLGVFKDYEDRFLDLFKQGEQG
ncbi:hypothetical protein ACFL59_15820, partial [Planctomycetota bacterium]